MLLDATVVTIQIAERKQGGKPPATGDSVESLIASNTGGGPSTTSTDTQQDGRDAPSQRREPRRKSSLVVYDDQPLWNLPAGAAQKLAAKEASASAEAMPTSADDIGGELASSLQRTGLASVDEGMRRDSIAMLRGKFDSTQLYEPPTFALLPQDTDVPPPVVRDRLVIEDFPVNTISTVWIKMVKQGLNEWIRMPTIVCRGSENG